jgi:serine/threonine protein kinase
MLYGTVPFKASNMADLHKQVVKVKPDYKENTEESASLKALSLLTGILEKDPSKRLTILQILEHPWMT